jgi:tetratricopeptide (TPR) repeat protein
MARLRPKNRARMAMFLAVALGLSLVSCVSRLERAKLYYAQAQRQARLYKTADAVASYKRALREAGEEAKSHPSAQAYTVKGMAELSLEMWKEARESFLEAYSYGFSEGEEWAADISVVGLAMAFEEMGLRDSALRGYETLLGKSKFRPLLFVAAHRSVELRSVQALAADDKERLKIFTESIKSIEKISDKDWSCGFYHYLLSQLRSHLGDYGRSFEEAVLGRELRLPSEKISRDNDLQIIFCYRELKKSLGAQEWTDFEARYSAWIKRWGWTDVQTPAWKKGAKHASND